MKRFNFIIAMTFVAGIAMAQNSAIISSVGDYQNANIDQGAANNNTAIITQTASGNTAADPTIASIKQISANSASIKQDGFRQVANFYQELGNVGTVVQKGSWDGSTNYIGGKYNYTQVEQYGMLNNGNIRTLHDYNGTEAEPLKIFQQGDGNFAEIWTGWATSSNGNHASITQLANANKSTINQESGDWNKATVIQYTNDNTANLNQTGSSLVATIDQYGDVHNTVNLNQTGGTADIDQNGTNNTVQGLKTGLIQDEWASFAGSSLKVYQCGADNTIDLKSTTSGSTVDVYQNGILNKSIVIQN